MSWNLDVFGVWLVAANEDVLDVAKKTKAMYRSKTTTIMKNGSILLALCTATLSLDGVQGYCNVRVLSTRSAIINKRSLDHHSVGLFSHSGEPTTKGRSSAQSRGDTMLQEPDPSDEDSRQSNRMVNLAEQDRDSGVSATNADDRGSWSKQIVDGIPFIHLFKRDRKLPPMQVQDFDVLFYDIFLLLTLSTSISFLVTHRMELAYIGSAFSEGCLLSILWILSGLYHGSFLYSAVDGHYDVGDEKAGPKAAAALALNTFTSAINLRLCFALIVAVAQHRPIGAAPAEELLPLEIAFGIALMSVWRALHSYYTPRL